MTISRRSFLGGATGAAIVGGGAWAALIRDGVETAAPSLASTTTLTPSSTTTTAAVAAAAANAGVAESLHDRVLVVLELAGGNDALNTLVPDLGRYHDARPLVGLGDAELIALAGTDHRLHPALGGLASFWDAGTMSAIAGVAMPEQSRSHFQAMDSWRSGTAGPSQTGWLGRWLDLSLDEERNGVDDPLRAIALGEEARRLWAVARWRRRSATRPTSSLRTQRGTDADALIGAFLATSAPLVDDPTLAAAQQAIPGTLDAVALLASARVDDATGLATPTQGVRPRNFSRRRQHHRHGNRDSHPRLESAASTPMRASMQPITTYLPTSVPGSKPSSPDLRRPVISTESWSSRPASSDVG